MLEFEAAVKRADESPIEFKVKEIKDVVFKFSPPKASIATLGIMTQDLDPEATELRALRDLWKWFMAGLSKKQQGLIESALNDPKSDLETSDVFIIARALQSEMTGRPTG